jgi:hypothetical protein
VIIIAAYVGVFWIPNQFYFGWAHFARIVSGLYLVIQEGLLILTAYTINEKLVEGYENGSTCAAVWGLSLSSYSYSFGFT